MKFYLLLLTCPSYCFFFFFFFFFFFCLLLISMHLHSVHTFTASAHTLTCSSLKKHTLAHSYTYCDYLHTPAHQSKSARFLLPSPRISRFSLPEHVVGSDVSCLIASSLSSFHSQPSITLVVAFVEYLTDSLQGQRLQVDSATQPAKMSWDPAALLNPKAATASPTPRNSLVSAPLASRAKSWDPNSPASPQPEMATAESSLPNPSSSSSAQPSLSGPLPNRSQVNGAQTTATPIFQFHNPAGEYLPDFSGGPYGGSVGLPNRTSSMPDFGVARHIERLSSIELRSDVPQPKRRKTQTESDPVSMHDGFHSQGTGILGQYVKDKSAHGVADRVAAQQGTIVRQPGTVDLTEEDEDVVMIDKPKDSIMDEEVCYGMVEGATVNCHRVPAPKPGAVSLHGDDYWPQVKVVLRKRTDDPNHKIHVYDCTRQVFGLVDAKVSNCLSPLIDSPLGIRTDCRIISRRKNPGRRLVVLRPVYIPSSWLCMAPANMPCRLATG